MAFKWTCPYCNHDTIIIKENTHISSSNLTIENKGGHRKLETQWIVCPNNECNKHVLYASLYDYFWADYWVTGDLLQQWSLVPQSSAKVFPNYVPIAIINDYEEACAIKDLSPKASATLARRCLQSMIRNFYSVKGKNLFEEIDSIRDKVDPLTWSSIDATRKIGNIGAHMEKDINLLIDVEPREAQILISLIEILIKDWYINRHERELMLQSVIQMAQDKTDLKKP